VSVCERVKNSDNILEKRKKNIGLSRENIILHIHRTIYGKRTVAT